MSIDYSSYNYLGFYNPSPMCEGFCTPIFIYQNNFFEQDIYNNKIIGMKPIQLKGMFFQHVHNKHLILGEEPIYAYFTGKELIIGHKQEISKQLYDFVHCQSYNLYDELKIDVLAFLGEYEEVEKLSYTIENKYSFKN